MQMSHACTCNSYTCAASSFFPLILKADNANDDRTTGTRMLRNRSTRSFGHSLVIKNEIVEGLAVRSVHARTSSKPLTIDSNNESSLSLQPDKNSGEISGFSFASTSKLVIHSTLLCSWAWYLSAKWRICVSSRSSQTWILSFLELLLAVPDLSAILEFTILLTSTLRSSHNG